MLGAIAKASTAVYLISFLIPATILTLLILMVALNSPQRRGVYPHRLFLILCILTASFVISLLFESILTFNNPLEGRLVSGLTYIGKSINIFLQATVNAFSFQNKLTFIFSFLVLISLLHFLYRLFKGITLSDNGVALSLSLDDVTDDSWRIAICNALVATAIPINVVGIILGSIGDVYVYRYLTFPLALALILLVIFEDKINLFSSHQRKYIFMFITLSFVVLSAQVYKRSSSFLSNPPPIAKCLNGIQNDGFVLKEGIGDYWNARGVSEYLYNKNAILATLNDMNPFFWMSSIGPIRRPDNYGYKYNFAIINSIDSTAPFSYTPLTIGKLLPFPNQIKKCSEAKAEIWLYDDDKLDSALKSAFDRFLWGRKLGNTYQIEGRMLPGYTGDIIGTARSANASIDKEGFLNFGPYIDLDAGKYEIFVHYSTTGPIKSTVGYIDMLGRQFIPPKDNLLYKKFIEANVENNLKVVLNIPANGMSKFEVRTWFSGVGIMTIESIKISRL